MVTISASLEDYLEGIYFLEEKNSYVRVSDLADLLDVKRPSVVKSLIKLKEKCLITQEHYGRIELTTEGRKMAKNIAIRHNILKDFLCKILDVDEKIAEEDACRIEHVINPQTYNNLTQFIEFMNVNNSQHTPDCLDKFKNYLKTGIRACNICSKKKKRK